MSRRKHKPILTPDDYRKGHAISAAASLLCSVLDDDREQLTSIGRDRLEAVKKALLDPDWICVPWHISDIRAAAEDCGYNHMSEETAREILYSVRDNVDCSHGINWDVIASAIDNHMRE